MNRVGNHRRPSPVSRRPLSPASLATLLLPLLAVGGGTKNRVWSQATSDISGVDQILCENTIGASYGDAFLAAVAIGDASVDEIAAWNPVTSTITAEFSDVYAQQYRYFRRLYEQTKDIARDLSP